jgi:hypothetical protein
MLVQTLDICNELYENNQTNINQYNPIQGFFKGKIFGKGAPLQPLERALDGKKLTARQTKANSKYIIDKIKCQIHVSYENKKIDFYDSGFESVKRALYLHQNLSKIHLEHGKEITVLEFLTQMMEMGIL